MKIEKDMFDVNSYIKITENTSGYELSDLVSVCKRFNNKKRDYLFVNHIQGKHVPVKPSKALKLMQQLACKVNDDKELKGKKICVVGFAETATAIGRHVASCLNDCVGVMQTTRECLGNTKELFTFDEEHSHAVSQKLYGDVNLLKDVDMFLFVEDEITTGNTILNFIDEFNKVLPNKEYAVASFLNWQSKEHENLFSSRGIRTYCLVRGYIKDISARINLYDNVFKASENVIVDDLSYINKETMIRKVTKSSFNQDRTVTLFNDGLGALHNSAYNIANDLHIEGKKVLVLGTEEFMYTGLMVAHGLEQRGVDVKFHATTRSPIALLNDGIQAENYVIKKGVKLPSIYYKDRVTYLYNIEEYDEVVLVTDTIGNVEFGVEILKVLSVDGVAPKLTKVIIN